MGVSIELYRSRTIGSHHNFIHCRNRLHCLKGKLWNQILLMFYILKYILFSLFQKPIKEGKRQQGNMPLVCTNGTLSCSLCAIIT